MLGVTLSVAVTVRAPAVFRVTLFVKVWTPASVPGTKVYDEGRSAAPSVELKSTVPA